MRRFAIGAIAAILLAAGALAVLDRADPPDLSRARRASVVVLDRDHTILRAFLAEAGVWRLPTSVSDVDPRYLTLLRAYEDRRFDEHWGVDPRAVLRAAWQWGVTGHIVSGASTLTMQAARLLEPREHRSIGAKLHQMARALQIEERLDKKAILGLYLTLAPFGGNLEGVRAASLAYFGKEPRHLTLGEAALLVALPQSPERLRPDRHPEAARAARGKVLNRLLEHGDLSAAEVEEALAEPLPTARRPFPFQAPHLAQHLASAAAPGAVVETPIDRTVQTALEALARREQARFDDGADLAVVVVENRSRAVRAYLGSADFFGAHGQIDLARARRSPGSALKPFIYGLAFDDRVVHPESLIDDEPMRFGDYAPRDFDRQFEGTVSVRHALQQSLNVPAVALLDRVGPVRFIGDLRAAGATISMRRLVGTPTLPVALGGLGISLADMTMLYASLPNGGEAEPLALTAEPPGAKVRLMGVASAWYLTDILKGSPLPPGFAQGQGLERTRAIAFKTGTSYGFRDAWSVGYSADYTVGVWVGRADGSPRPGHYGRNTAAPILFKVFDLLPPDQGRFPPAPTEVLSVESNGELPAGLRHFRHDRTLPQRPGTVAPPHILFPPEGAVVEWRPGDGEHGGLPLKAEGGAKPLSWVVNGTPITKTTLTGMGFWQPDGEGFVRIAVVDAQGRSAQVRVRVVSDR
ncbi:MAG TPA: penicillin-binding protein 1C [Stellaceae bacterium]|nr:penicillin-binding protein 1C [Stellaceae bacterium]